MNKKYNLTSSQFRVLFEFDDKGNIVFTNKNVIWGHLKINQEVDFNRLVKALNYCFKKNDNMRTKLCKENDKIYQYFEKYQKMNFEIVDVGTEDDVKKLLNDTINKPLEMFDSFLFNMVIYRYKNGFGGLIIKLNHVMGDGYTLGLVLYEVLSYLSGKRKMIIPFSYSNYIKSEEKYQFSRKYKQDKLFWEEIFEKGVPDVAYIPTKKENFSYSKSNKLVIDIDDEIVKKVKKICKVNEVSDSTFYMSVYGLYVNKRTDLTNFFLSAANRNRKKIREMLTAGMMTKTAYCIVNIQNEKFSDFVKKMKISLKSCYQHMDYIYNYLKELFKKYNDNRIIPSKVFVSYQNLQLNTDKMNINFEVEGDNNVGTYGFDVISIHVFEYKGKVKIIYDYLSEQYSKEEITNINNGIINIINQVSENNNILVQDINI